MPKERRTRASLHTPSAKLHKRTFAVTDNAVEHVEIGTAAEASANEILAALNKAVPQEKLTKKDKQILKREAFLQKLGALKTPHSKSHARREKRKAKEQLAGSGMSDIQAILNTIAEDEQLQDEDTGSAAKATEKTSPDSMDTETERPKSKSRQAKTAKIGEGKNMPLNKNQRRRVLEMEKFRQPLIRSNPDFTKSPFQTIRTHAQNTLTKHRIS